MPPWGWLLPAYAVVLSARLWALPHAALPDFDSVRNWLTVQELARGQWQNLFRHLSPTFYLAFVPLAVALARDFHVALYATALLGTVAVALLARTFARWGQWKAVDEALLAVLLGLSTEYVYTSRDFAITTPALLVLAGALHAYQHRSATQRRGPLLRTAAWLAVGLTLNYKVVLLLPGVAWLEWRWARAGAPAGGRTLALAAGVLAAPFVGYAVVAAAVGLPWYRLVAGWLGIVYHPATNAAGRISSWQPDYLFYLRYLRDFESPLLVLGLLAGPWLAWRARDQRPFAPLLVLTVLAWGQLLGLSLLLKAPRGLVFVLGPLVALGVQAVRTITGKRYWLLGRSVLGVLALGQGWLLWQHVWRYDVAARPSPYAQVAAGLPAHCSVLYTTGGLGVAPWVPATVRVEPLTTRRALLDSAAAPGCWLLLDPYCHVIGLDSLGAAARSLPGRTVRVAAAPRALSPLLYLEHAEYTGLGYAATLHRAANAPHFLILRQVGP